MTVLASLTQRRALRSLLGGAIDYAGLFPPAALEMASAVRNFNDYLHGDESWALGRFVVALARLPEFESAATPYFTTRNTGPAWRLSALLGPAAAGGPTYDASVRDFNERLQGRARVESIEGQARTVAEVLALRSLAGASIVFVELPAADASLDVLLAAVRDIGAYAKLRSGGITADAFPAPRDVARFIVACRDAGVAFKATAGLHHPVRGVYPLTYAPDSPRGVMYGYLNVVLASALATQGGTEEQVAELLEQRDSRSLRVSDEGVTWHGAAIPTTVIDRARQRSMLSFGSCSFREPLDDLGQLADA